MTVNAVKKLGVVFTMVAALAGCATVPGLDAQTVGTVLGGVVGGEMARQMGGKGRAPVIAGTIIGSLIGAGIGAKMDQVDQMQHQNAFNAATRAPMNQPVRWENRQSGHYGTVTPLRQGKNQMGQTCREFESTVAIDGQMETATGTACLTQNGTWQIQP